MDLVMVMNVILSGFVFSIWSKTNGLNLLIKMLLFTAMVVNILRLAGTV